MSSLLVLAAKGEDEPLTYLVFFLSITTIVFVYIIFLCFPKFKLKEKKIQLRTANILEYEEPTLIQKLFRTAFFVFYFTMVVTFSVFINVSQNY